MLVDLLKIAEEQYDPEVVALLRRLHMRALHLQVPPRPGHEGMPDCWFGGRPTLPAEMDWPCYVRNGHAIPMHFLAQFDCASLPKLEEYPMPASGTVMFFYEPILNMDRVTCEDEPEGGRVIYLEDVSGVALRDPPIIPDVDPEALMRPDDEFEGDFELRIDIEHWNAQNRGKLPMFNGPFGVEAIVIGTFRSSKNEEERKITNDLHEKFAPALAHLLWDTNEAAIDTFAGVEGGVYHRLFGGIFLHRFSKSETLVQLLHYESGDCEWATDEGPGFNANFMIEIADLKDGDLDKAFVGEG